MSLLNKNMLYDTYVVDAVEKGLSKKNKMLPSWLHYDEVGDGLFQDIMNIPEYYITRCEFEIFHNWKERISKLPFLNDGPFKVVELGAGDGVKTEVLLRHFNTCKLQFTYVPVDVSDAVLSKLTDRLRVVMPDLDVQPKSQLYHDALKSLNTNSDEKKLILFLGANIGNFTYGESEQFICKLGSNMCPRDYVLMGFDLKKDPSLIESAYNDKGGVTKAFNLNLLKRLNRDLGAQFILNEFSYHSFYNPETGAVRSYIISRQDQDVFIQALDKSFNFHKWEAIHTEISQKYDMDMIHNIVAQAGLKIIDIFYDEKKYFCDVLMGF